MSYLRSLKKSLINKHPETKESTIDLYINNVENILKFIIGKEITSQQDLLLIVRNIPLLEEYFDDNNRSDTTRANYYSSLLEVLKAIDNPVKGVAAGIKRVKTQRDKYRKKYDKIEDGLKSKKQDENFTSKEIYGEDMAEIINDKINQYEKKVKNKSEDKDLLQIWMILKILREFRFRNEIATLEFVDKKTYDNEVSQEGPLKRNLIVMAPDGWFISKNQYKTDKKYGENIIPLEGDILKDFKFYYSKVGDGMLFKSSFQNGKKRPKIMTSNALTKYITKWSNKELPPVVLEDGSQKPRNLSTTMIVKIYESKEHGASKKKLIKDSKNRGNKPETMSKVYVSTK